jgi:hypothetical protein
LGKVGIWLFLGTALKFLNEMGFLPNGTLAEGIFAAGLPQKL